MAADPHAHFADAHRGHVRVTVDRQRWRGDFRVVPYVLRKGARVSTRASLVVGDGRPGVQTS